MRYQALATDYDGTIADDGVVDELTLAALARLRDGARRLILITGRDLADLRRVMPRLDLFDLVVAENGALLYDPANHEVRALGDAPPPAFVERLRELEVAPLWLGQVIVATQEPNVGKVVSAIRDLGLNLRIACNKGVAIVLPSGVTKASGLRGALAQLGLSPLNCIGVGDAENDLAFLGVCGLPVAVANALPSVKERAAFVTEGKRGAGVAELIDQLLATDLAGFDAIGERERVAFVADDLGKPPLCVEAEWISQSLSLPEC
ncbi:MAG: HAD family hydrolase [Acetobacteraceae bacterium]|jgi:hydroxymethylpyrimidine pyrophosphatase-like HAD family hydrolase